MGRGKAARDKGKRGERLLVGHLRRLFPEYADKIERGWQTRISAGEMDVKGVPGIWWENKYTEKPAPVAALRQAINDPRRDEALMPIGVIISPGKPNDPFAILRLGDLVKLIRIGMEVVGLHGKVHRKERAAGEHGDGPASKHEERRWTGYRLKRRYRKGPLS